MDTGDKHKLLVNAVYLAIGVLIIAALIIALQAVLGYAQVESTPPGWEIIRPPAEVSTLIIVNDTVWTGGKEGLVLISRTNSTRLPLPEDAPATSYIRQIFRDHNGSIWIAHDGGLARFTGRSWEVIAPAPGIPFRRVLSLAELKDNRIVAGTDTDAFVFNDTGWQSLTASGMPSIALAEVLLVTRSGDLWVGCGDPMRGALLRFDGKAWHQYTTNDGLPHPAVRSLFEDKNEAVWAATGYSRNGGAARFSAGSWTNYTVVNGLAGESTRSVFEDNRGRMWVGSEYDGIAIGSGRSWKIVAMKDGLAGNEVKIIAQDTDGTYWLGTEKGLSRIERLSAP
jgi:ligand-binding sensor domain-containing protein